MGYGDFSLFLGNNTHYQSVILNKNVYLHCSTGEMVGLNIESVFALSERTKSPISS